MSYAALSVPDVMELKRAAREQPRSGPAPSAAWTRAALASGDETHTPRAAVQAVRRLELLPR